ncbi:hypothetical protein [Cetobacterium ceti]
MKKHFIYLWGVFFMFNLFSYGALVKDKVETKIESKEQVKNEKIDEQELNKDEEMNKNKIILPKDKKEDTITTEEDVEQNSDLNPFFPLDQEPTDNTEQIEINE